MGNLSLYSSSHLQNGAVGSTSPAGDNTPDHGGAAGDGYLSEDFVPGTSSSRERKKGVPWTEEEHRMFLLGLQKLGKGDWRGIARNYVISRTPTQVASHAQKYFIRQSNMSRRKRRSSLFDIIADESGDTPMVTHEFLSAHPAETDTQNNNTSPPAPAIDEEYESMASTNSNEAELGLSTSEPSQGSHPNDVSQSEYLSGTSQSYYPVVYPTFASPFYPFPIPFWTNHVPEPAKETHEVVKPTAVHSKSPINVDELIGMSKLSLGDTIGSGEPSSLSLKLLGSTRQSAFHAKSASSSSGMNSSSNSPIHAV